MPNIQTRTHLEIPDDLDPDEDWCVVIQIPGDTQYLEQLSGYLSKLGWSSTFARDETGTQAAQVSRRWQRALDKVPPRVVECGFMVDVRQNSDDPCELDKTFDDGTTWEQWANLQLCAPQVMVAPDGSQWWWNPAGNGGAGDWEPVPIPGGGAKQDAEIPPGPIAFPPGTPEYEDCTGRCIGAANVTQILKTDLFSTVQDIITVADGALGALAIISVLTMFVGVAIDLIILAIALVGAAAGLTVETAQDLYDEIDWNTVRDLLYCHMTCAGAMTPGDLEAFLFDLNETYPSNAVIVLLTLMTRGAGAAQINSLARLTQSDISADCSGAACDDWEIEFGNGNGWGIWDNWDLPSNREPQPIGELIGLGDFWNPTEWHFTFSPGSVGSGNYLELSYPAGFHCTKLEFYFELAEPGSTSFFDVEVNDVGTGAYAQVTVTDHLYHRIYTVNDDVTLIHIASNNSNGDADPPIGFKIFRCIIRGTGTEPDLG